MLPTAATLRQCGVNMHPLEYLTIALAVVAVAARVAMFLPRPPKGPFKAI